MDLFVFVKAGNSVNEVINIMQLSEFPWADYSYICKRIGTSNSSVLGNTSVQAPEGDSLNTFLSETAIEFVEDSETTIKSRLRNCEERNNYARVNQNLSSS